MNNTPRTPRRLPARHRLLSALAAAALSTILTSPLSADDRAPTAHAPAPASLAAQISEPTTVILPTEPQTSEHAAPAAQAMPSDHATHPAAEDNHVAVVAHAEEHATAVSPEPATPPQPAHPPIVETTPPPAALPPVPPPAPHPAPLQVAAPAPSSTPSVTITVKDPNASKNITNIWVDSDIRQVIQDISSQADIVIVCDQTVQGAVSMSVKDMPVADALERVCAVGGYSFTKVKDYYVVGKADPGTAMFQRISEPVRIKLAHINPDQVRGLLQPSMLPYANFDKSSGTVVVTAPEPMRDRVLNAIKLIDQANPQVAIEAVVFELTESGSKQLALDWQFKAGNVTIGAQNLVNTFTYGVGSDLGTFVNISLRAIVESGKGQVLANPKVLCMNNAEAEIFVGQEKYYTLLSGQASNPYYTLQSIKAGVTLKVCPSIGSNGQITLNLEPEVSDVVDDPVSNGVNNLTNGLTTSPVVTRRRAKTVVDIADGNTLLIGGLIRDQHRQIIDKNPYIGDVPGIGAPFRSIHEENIRQEVVILITVHMVEPSRPGNEKLTSRLTQRYVTPLDAITVPTGLKTVVPPPVTVKTVANAQGK